MLYVVRKAITQPASTLIAPSVSIHQVLLDFAKMEAYLGDRAQAIKIFETAVKRFPTQDR
jgi:hypothetical protein